MLIKIQQHIMSVNWTIFENAKNVQYSLHPQGFGTLKEYEEFERDFLTKHSNANVMVYKEANGKKVWASGATYFVNQISFLNEQSYLENCIFDGEAYICNNDGKTVHRVHTAGFVQSNPMPEAA